MRNVFGKLVYDTLEEKLDPTHTAIIVVDMQNDLCKPRGRSNSPQGPSPNMAIVPALSNLLRIGRQSGVKLVYIAYAMDPSGASAAPAWIYYCQRKKREGKSYAMNLEVCLEGTWGQEIIEELSPQPGDIVVTKNRLGGFWNTNLDQTLRANRIKTVVITGTATSGCVLDTAVGAAAHDYYTICASDSIAGGESHELGMLHLEDRFDSLSTEEFAEIWKTTP
jgi:nicotinamidase-related amidase